VIRIRIDNDPDLDHSLAIDPLDRRHQHRGSTSRRCGPGRTPGDNTSPPMSRYRCYLAHSLGIAESGVHPFVQLRAATAEIAARLAIAVTGAIAVVEVVRLEEVTP